MSRRVYADIFKDFHTARGLGGYGGEQPRRFDTLGVAAQDEIEVAVLIEVGPTAAEADALHLIEADRKGFVLELAVALVAKDVLFAGTGDDEIELAVVVVVGGGSTEARPRSRQPRGGRHVRVGVVPVVLQKQVANLAVLKDGRGHKDIGLPIAVVIEKHDGRTEAFAGRLANRIQVRSGCPARSQREHNFEIARRFEHR